MDVKSGTSEYIQVGKWTHRSEAESWCGLSSQRGNGKGTEGRFWRMVAFKIQVKKKKLQKQLTSGFRNKRKLRNEYCLRNGKKQLQGLLLTQAPSF